MTEKRDDYSALWCWRGFINETRWIQVGQTPDFFFFFMASPLPNLMLSNLSVITIYILLKSISFLSNCKGSVESATARSVSNNVFIKLLYKQESVLIARLTCHLALWTSYRTLTYEWKLERIICNLLHERNTKMKWKCSCISVAAAIKELETESWLESHFNFPGRLDWFHKCFLPPELQQLLPI